jgi:hypothetical protein
MCLSAQSMNLLLNAEEITIFSIAAHPDGWETCFRCLRPDDEEHIAFLTHVYNYVCTKILLQVF